MRASELNVRINIKGYQMNTLYRDNAYKLFEKQIKCLIMDDRESQMKLYSDDLRYEFPFANDRPRLIESKESFRKIMEPLWAEARQKGIRVVDCDSEFHATDEQDLFLAIFDLKVKVAENQVVLPFVQILRIKDDFIVSVKEYFNSPARNAAIKSVK